jgi:alanine dehydrogenase
MSDQLTLAEELARADLIIGAVLIPGARAPHLISREALGSARAHAVLVDVAIDQGGVAESSRPTTHDSPTYEEAGVVHYCVANMPGAVPATSTRALTNATLPYVRALARDVAGALGADPGLARGVNVRDGEIVYEPVAEGWDRRAPAPA